MCANKYKLRQNFMTIIAVIPSYTGRHKFKRLLFFHYGFLFSNFVEGSFWHLTGFCAIDLKSFSISGLYTV